MDTRNYDETTENILKRRNIMIRINIPNTSKIYIHIDKEYKQNDKTEIKQTKIDIEKETQYLQNGKIDALLLGATESIELGIKHKFIPTNTDICNQNPTILYNKANIYEILYENGDIHDLTEELVNTTSNIKQIKFITIENR